MNNKGQFDYPIITFALVIIGLLLLAPIMLKILNVTQDKFSDSLGNISNGGDVAQANFNVVMDTATGWWDKVIVFAFFTTILLLFVSSFFIDSHPFFIIIYILFSFMLILFAPNIIQAVDNIYNSSDFAAESAALSFMDTIRVHYAEFLIGIMIITGIIIYGKISMFGGNRR